MATWYHVEFDIYDTPSSVPDRIDAMVSRLEGAGWQIRGQAQDGGGGILPTTTHGHIELAKGGASQDQAVQAVKDAAGSSWLGLGAWTNFAGSIATEVVIPTARDAAKLAQTTATAAGNAAKGIGFGLGLTFGTAALVAVAVLVLIYVPRPR